MSARTGRKSGPKPAKPSSSGNNRHNPDIHRTITYRIGWKKGYIEVGEDGKIVTRSARVPSPAEAVFDKTMREWMWRKLPFLSARALIAALWLLPAISFGATVWLVYLLAND